MRGFAARERAILPEGFARRRRAGGHARHARRCAATSRACGDDRRQAAREIGRVAPSAAAVGTRRARIEPMRVARQRRHVSRAVRQACRSASRRSTPRRAAKVSAMRWRSTGAASLATSSSEGERRPLTSARARVASISACAARGPGPQATCGAIAGSPSPGRAARTRSRMASTIFSPTGSRRTRRCVAISSSARQRLRRLRDMLAGRLHQDAPLVGAVGIDARRSASGSGRAAPRAADRCPPAPADFASRAHGTGAAGRARWPATLT